MSLFALLRWSLRLDREFLFAVKDISLSQRLHLVFCKYIFFLRDRLMSVGTIHHAHVCGLRYLYNDRFGLGSLQRVFCSSRKLKGIVTRSPVVVDVGANLGQFNLFSRVYLNAERIISIEPLPTCFELLAANVEHQTDCFNLLVSEREGETPFYVASDSQLSSTVRDDYGDYCEKIVVQGMPLDRVLKKAGVDRINLLKIDTEGSELEVLRSAGEVLDKTDVVLVEMSIFRKSAGNLFAVGSFLEARGFRLQELVFGDVSHPADVDGIFVRI